MAVRLCIVDDVDEVDGVWQSLGDLSIAGGMVVAADPFCVPAASYCLTFAVRPGTYVAEAFIAAEDRDSLALRIRRP